MWTGVRTGQIRNVRYVEFCASEYEIKDAIVWVCIVPCYYRCKRTLAKNHNSHKMLLDIPRMLPNGFCLLFFHAQKTKRYYNLPIKKLTLLNSFSQNTNWMHGWIEMERTERTESRKPERMEMKITIE